MIRPVMSRVAVLGTVLVVALQSVVSASAAENLLSYNKSIVTSADENAGVSGKYAVDGDTATRWASAVGSDPQWITVDLGGQPLSTR